MVARPLRRVPIHAGRIADFSCTPGLDESMGLETDHVDFETINLAAPYWDKQPDLDIWPCRLRQAASCVFEVQAGVAKVSPSSRACAGGGFQNLARHFS